MKLYILLLSCLFMLSCAVGSRWPDSRHDSRPKSDGSYLSDLLAWEIVLGTAAAGICAGLAVVLSSSPVKFASLWLWAGAGAGACVAILALALHTALPFLPWVAGGALVVSGIIVALHFSHPRASRIEASLRAKAKKLKLPNAQP
jgi:hypothetical protein